MLRVFDVSTPALMPLAETLAGETALTALAVCGGCGEFAVGRTDGDVSLYELQCVCPFTVRVVAVLLMLHTARSRGHCRRSR
jgi:hypothetical protein